MILMEDYLFKKKISGTELPQLLFPQIRLKMSINIFQTITAQGVHFTFFFYQSLQSLPRLHRCERPLKALNAMWVYSHSYWLVIFCTTNSRLAMEGSQTFKNSRKKTIFNEQPERSWVGPKKSHFFMGCRLKKRVCLKKIFKGRLWGRAGERSEGRS